MHLDTLGVLFVCLLTVQAGPVSIYKTVVGCAGKYVSLTCKDLAESSIEVISAEYGRTTDRTCVTNPLLASWVRCTGNSVDHQLAVALKCDARLTCSVAVTNTALPSPCVAASSPYYLKVNYRCRQEYYHCTKLPLSCKVCTFMSPCSKTCGFGKTMLVYQCTGEYRFPPAICEHDCCIKLCDPGNNTIPPPFGTKLCKDMIPHVTFPSCSSGWKTK